MYKSIKTILFAILVVGLSLGFASCSDDEEEEAIVIETKRIPTKIVETTISDDEEEESYTYSFEYDASNRIVSTSSFGRTSNVSYDANGFITKIGNMDYTYDAKDGKVEEKKNGNVEQIFFIDKNGFLKSFDIYETSLNSVETYESIYGGEIRYTYTYDINNNLTNATSYVNDKKHNEEYSSKTAISYGKYYSPFVMVKTHKWALSLELEVLSLPEFSTATMGSHFVAKAKSEGTDIYIRTDESGKDVMSKDEWENIITFEVTKSEDNYPTEITQTSVYKETGEEESTSKTVYTIEYKNAN